MNKSPVGRPFNELVQERAGKDLAFARSLLEEAVECMLAGELPTARSLIRDAIKGSLGYAELSKRTGTPEKSLVRMFGPSGNPTAENFSTVLRELQRHGRLRLRVRSEPVPRARPGKGRTTSARDRSLGKAFTTARASATVCATGSAGAQAVARRSACGADSGE